MSIERRRVFDRPASVTRVRQGAPERGTTKNGTHMRVPEGEFRNRETIIARPSHGLTD